MFEDEVEELMCDYGLSPMDARSIAKELRATKHALWMARALRAGAEAKRFFWFLSVDVSQGNREAEIWHESLYKKWCWAERKCREKAKEFE